MSSLSFLLLSSFLFSNIVTSFSEHHHRLFEPDHRSEQHHRTLDMPAFQRFFLNALGMPDRPSTTDRNSSSTRPHPDPPTRPPRVPGYIWDLYQEISGSATPWRVPPRTALVRNFFPELVNVSSFHSSIQLRIHFNLSRALRPGETLTAARLKLKSSPFLNASIRLSLYETIHAEKDINRLLDTLSLSPASLNRRPSQWMDLDASAAVVRALATPEPPLLILSLSAQLSHVSTAEEISNALLAAEPALVLFGKDASLDVVDNASEPSPLKASEKLLLRRKRRTGGNRRRTGRRGKGGRRKAAALTNGLGWHSSLSHCRRWPLYIDFRELNWQDWILAPQGLPSFV